MSTCESDLETSACLIVIVTYVAIGQLMRLFYVGIDFRLRKLTCMCVEKTHVYLKINCSDLRVVFIIHVHVVYELLV